MAWHEFVTNLHMHTPYSDGEWHHTQIAEAAINAGLDMICVTDHNVWVKGPERYHEKDGRRVLVLVGEEIHDPTRLPQKNHLLAYNCQRELARCAPRPQELINAVRECGGLAFLAHPHDNSVPLFDYEDISWVNWEVTGYTGLEIWNYMSNWAGLLTSRSATIRYAVNPELGILGPDARTLARWDELTAAGQRVVGIGNSDAHANEVSKWGYTRVIFPYEFLFRQVNTHLLSLESLTGELAHDRAMLMRALARGNGFIGYDGIGATTGFRFTASTERGSFVMGDELLNRAGVTLQVVTPQPAHLRLLRNGEEIVRREGQSLTHGLPPDQNGVYRVEAHLPFKGQLRGWIYSNPLYVRA
jgi:hypothetical protein